MDPRRFDTLVRTLTTGPSRRRLLGVLSALPLVGTALAASVDDDISAKGKRKTRRKDHGTGTEATSCVKQCRKKASKRARRRCRKQCTPPAPECTTSQDCPTGELCESGVCIPSPDQCATDTDCDDCEQCQNGICTAQCAPDQVCRNNQCETVACTANRECGDCSRCIEGRCRWQCTVTEVCLSGAGGRCCQPRGCPAGTNCGTVEDGCGGTVPCGSCPLAGQPCTDNVCGTCVPTCTGKVCGADDGCGGMCQSGTCTGAEVCGGGGMPGVCGCETNAQACGSQTCGTAVNNCGITVPCTGCTGCCAGNTCVASGAQTPGQCGTGTPGAACVACPTCQTCSGGMCITDPAQDGQCCGTANGGTRCQNGSCVTATATLTDCQSRCDHPSFPASVTICGQSATCPSCNQCEALGCVRTGWNGDGPAGVGTYCRKDGNEGTCSTVAQCPPDYMCGVSQTCYPLCTGS